MSVYISAQNVEKLFKDTHALNGVNLELMAGEQCALKGASGSGKSTFLYLLGGMDKPSKGKIFVGGRDIVKLGDQDLANYRNLEVGFVFQFHFLLPTMGVLDNILLPAKIAGRELEPIKKKAIEFAERLGVSHCLGKASYELSGGEQQRVSIIRALSLSPKLLLCDEPTGNLDSENTKIVVTLLREMAHELGSTLPRRIEMKDGRLI
jgi:lipoprotein-releasing system ATP-binding protein